MDDLSYKYDYYDNAGVRHTYVPGVTTLADSDRPTNRLNSVDDGVSSGNYSIDVDDQAVDNYEYDEIGNLIKDQGGEIDNIEWTVYGKIKTITKADNSTVNYTYDASGNRISKQVGDKTTFYVRDASGNVMAIYEKGNNNVNSGKLSQIEVDLYGSSRLGLWHRNLDVESTNWWLFSTTTMTGTNGGRDGLLFRGQIAFELSNHLGNVLVTVSDRKIQKEIGIEEIGTPAIFEEVDWPYTGGNPQNVTGPYVVFRADVISATDYYPFGMVMPERKYTGNGYRYGFNGKEQDKDISNEAYDYGMRISDQRLARFLSVDPITSHYPELTPYQYASNRPIDGIDLDGLEWSFPIGFGRSLPRISIPQVIVPPPPTIPFPPIVVPNAPQAPNAPSSSIPQVEEWELIDLESPNVLRIPGSELENGEYRQETEYRPLWSRPLDPPKWLHKASNSQKYRPGELDDPAWQGGYKDKRSPKELNKQKSKDDVPDWARGYRPRKGEKGGDFAQRLMDKKYGPGKWKQGPGTEYNKIKKFGDQDFKNVIYVPGKQYEDLEKKSKEYNRKLRKAMKQNIEQIEKEEEEKRKNPPVV